MDAERSLDLPLTRTRSSTEATVVSVPGVIENPVINSPYQEPQRHFVFDTQGITNQIAQGRRASTFFIPIAPVLATCSIRRSDEAIENT